MNLINFINLINLINFTNLPRRAKNVLALFALVAAGGCIHQDPDGEGVDPTLVRVTMEVAFDDDLLPVTAANAARAAAEPPYRFIVEARREGKVAHRQVIVLPADSIPAGKFTLPVAIPLHALDYTLAAWVDRAADDNGNDLHHDATDLQLVACTEPYTGNTPYRDCYRGTAPLDLGEYRERWNATAAVSIPLERPLAAYRLVATDAAKFIEDTRQQRDAGQTYTLTVKYGFYFPLGCNAITGEPGLSTMNVTFTAPLLVTDDGSGECTVAADYIFAGAGESYMPLSIEIRDADGKGISRTTGINVTYKRGQVTTLRGRFLTGRFDTGVGIDPDFEEGDIEVEI